MYFRGCQVCKTNIKEDLVFSFGLHLGLIPYPLTIDSLLFTLGPWTLSLIPYPLSHVPTPGSLSLNPQKCSFQENFGKGSCGCYVVIPSKLVYIKKIKSVCYWFSVNTKYGLVWFKTKPK